MATLDTICISVKKGTVKVPIPAAELRAGHGIEGGVDLDGDGSEDFVVGAPETDSSSVPFGGLAGEVAVVSGRTGDRIRSTFGESVSSSPTR